MSRKCDETQANEDRAVPPARGGTPHRRTDTTHCAACCQSGRRSKVVVQQIHVERRIIDRPQRRGPLHLHACGPPIDIHGRLREHRPRHGRVPMPGQPDANRPDRHIDLTDTRGDPLPGGLHRLGRHRPVSDHANVLRPRFFGDRERVLIRIGSSPSPRLATTSPPPPRPCSSSANTTTPPNRPRSCPSVTTTPDQRTRTRTEKQVGPWSSVCRFGPKQRAELPRSAAMHRERQVTGIPHRQIPDGQIGALRRGTITATALADNVRNRVRQSGAGSASK